MKNNRNYEIMVMCVTDIIKNGSYIFFASDNQESIAQAFNFDSIEQGYFFSKCLSRKKQLAPLILNVVK